LSKNNTIFRIFQLLYDSDGLNAYKIAKILDIQRASASYFLKKLVMSNVLVKKNNLYLVNPEIKQQDFWKYILDAYKKIAETVVKKNIDINVFFEILKNMI